jgi:osmoprotectant transport system ATP-binding protein
VIELRDVSLVLRGKPLLSSVELALEPGRTHVLLGASGSGKTTLLKLIAGTLAPTSGTVRVDGVPVEVRDPVMLSDRLGYMTQEGGLFPHLTVAENVTLVARVRGWKKEDLASRLEELASMVGIDRGMLGRHPARLSGGQRQRVALIRALFLRPRYVLLDEPLGALDPLIRRDLQATLKSVFASLSTTVILVTHDVGEAAFFGDTITLLDAGRIMQHGTFEQLVREPKDPYVTEFLLAQRPVPQLGLLAS